MSENQKKILQMLADGEIKFDESQKLLALVSSKNESESQKQVLQMLADGEIKFNEAQKLLALVDPKNESEIQKKVLQILADGEIKFDEAQNLLALVGSDKVNENQKKILQLLAGGKINIDEAQKLLALVGSKNEKENMDRNSDTATKSSPRYLHVMVEPKSDAPENPDWHHHGRHKVNIKVPFGLIRAGVKLATLIPSDTAEHVDMALKEKGFNFDVRRIKEEDLEDLLAALRENEIDIDSEYERVRLYAD